MKRSWALLGDKWIERFHSRVDSKTNPDGCWPWAGATNPKGYGRVGVGQIVYLPHRIAWFLKNGTIPKGMSVCHRCDNPRCCNPSHLFCGTIADNNRDMDKKGRRVTKTSYGEEQKASKLSDKLVRLIRAVNRKRVMSNTEMAKEVGVSITIIGRVVNRLSWKHVK